MSKTSELLKSPHIHVALVTGGSIIIMAYISKRIFTEPIPNLHLAIPPFIMVIWEALHGKHKEEKFMTTWYWMAAVVLSTAIIILANMS